MRGPRPLNRYIICVRRTFGDRFVTLLIVIYQSKGAREIVTEGSRQRRWVRRCDESGSTVTAIDRAT